jgi:FKBP-type peptidyl-prolyl cis-trans isomerase 2
MTKSTKPGTKKVPEPYVGETVNVKTGGRVVSATIIEVGDTEVCVDFNDGTEPRWISRKAITR